MYWPALSNGCFLPIFEETIGELGLDINMKKLVPPSTAVACLGILVDSVPKTISVPSDKLAEIVQLCADWAIVAWLPPVCFQMCETF